MSAVDFSALELIPKLLKEIETLNNKVSTLENEHITKNNLLKWEEELFNKWWQMKQRCMYPSSNNRKEYYIDKGIKVCKKWENNFHRFMFWSIQNGYKSGLSLDRIDSNSDYKPSNCRWVSSTVQARNTKRIRKTNTSGYRGVSFKKSRNKYVSRICIDGKSIHLGYFETALDGGIAYDKYIIDNNLEHTTNGLIR